TEGFITMPDALEKAAAADLLAKVNATRKFDRSLFLTEEEFNAGDRSHRHTNPRDGRNILEQFEGELSFVYDNPGVNRLLEGILGKGFRWYLKKMVCRVPMPLIPEWIHKGTGGNVTNTLGAFMHPQWRDISYYYENDLHQDIIDYPRLPLEIRDHRYITLFVDLLEDHSNFVPPTIFPRTHMLGATLFQHDMQRVEGNHWVYGDERGNHMDTHAVDLNSYLGFAGIWHSCLVHGARPLADTPGGKMHVSMRFLVAQGDNPGPCAMDEVNAAVKGPLFIAEDYTPGPRANKEGFVKLGRSDFLKGDW
ncbi:MAG: hypothetical protein K2Q01_00905, partial [Rickettsiales bacterium]|nr:hypothetical protein [Rickettsiales bacterium]